MQALWIGLALVSLAAAALLAYWLVTQFPIATLRKIIPSTMEGHKTRPQQGVVKHDWLPTGRIDFTARLDVGDQSKDKPGEFKLLVEERRIVESIAGNENLEIQWRLATLSEAKTVISQYNKYLSENSLIKSLPELSLPAPHSVSSPPTNGKENIQQFAPSVHSA